MAQNLLDEVARRIDFIQSSGGYGEIRIIFKLERMPEVSTTVTERVAA